MKKQWIPKQRLHPSTRLYYFKMGAFQKNVIFTYFKTGAKILKTKMSHIRIVSAEVYFRVVIIRIIMRAILTLLGNDAVVAIVWRFQKPIGNVDWYNM